MNSLWRSNPLPSLLIQRNSSVCTRPTALYTPVLRHFAANLRVASSMRSTPVRTATTGSVSSQNAETQRIRNIGIIAHIDAGKTTTTERMLHYTGYIDRIGEVHHGDTVMDYLPQERERGITITAAAITFEWRSHRINLIDTPGHVDFTVEVARSTRVLDGAVAVFDAVAGVEAQTETVWKQADRYRVPRICFVNKMDRTGAGFGRTVREMRTRLNCKPIVLQWPIFYADDAAAGKKAYGGTGFRGVIDLVELTILDWDAGQNSGSVITRSALSETSIDPEMKRWYAEAKRGREALVESLAELDDLIVDAFLGPANADHMLVPADDIRAAIRRVTGDGRAVPVLCGAAFRNIGVQPLLDAVVDYLPSPAERPPPVATMPDGREMTVSLTDPKQGLVALAFKVAHDPRRGPLVFVRVYSGTLEARCTLLNTNRRVKEKVMKVFQMYANDVEEIPCITAGNIGVVVGLKDTRTGDTLVGATHGKAITTTTKGGKDLILQGVDIPPPVFFCAVEPTSITEEARMTSALQNLLREDPSLLIREDPDSGQTLLCGMGELHLDVVKKRLEGELGVSANIGRVRTAYRETFKDTLIGQTADFDKDVLGVSLKAGLTIDIEPRSEETGFEGSVEGDNDYADTTKHDIHLCRSKDNQNNIIHIDLTDMKTDEEATIHKGSKSSLAPEKSFLFDPITLTHPSTKLTVSDIHEAILQGLETGLARGPLLGFPLGSLVVRARSLRLFPVSLSDPHSEIHLRSIRGAAAMAIAKAVQVGTATLLEPMMNVEISVQERDLGTVVGDLSGVRRGRVDSVDDAIQDYSTSLNNSSEVFPPDEHVGDSASSSHSDESNARRGRKIVKAKVPLATLVGYSTVLRSITAGTGTFQMELAGFGSMTANEEKSVLLDFRGY